MKKLTFFQLLMVCILACTSFINIFSQCTAEAGEAGPSTVVFSVGDLPITGAYDYTTFFNAPSFITDGAADDITYFLVGNNNEFLSASSFGVFDFDNLPFGSQTLPNPLMEIGDSICIYQVIYNQDSIMQFEIQANSDNWFTMFRN